MKNLSKNGTAILILAASWLLALQPALSAEQEQDYLFGTWELVPELSVFNDEREVPTHQLRIYKPHPDGIEAIIRTTSPHGVETESSYVAAYDGVPHPVYGLNNADSIMLQKVSPYTAVATFIHAGLETGSAERTISTTGTEMTITQKLNGQVISRMVYKKIE